MPLRFRPTTLKSVVVVPPRQITKTEPRFVILLVRNIRLDDSLNHLVRLPLAVFLRNADCPKSDKSKISNKSMYSSTYLTLLCYTSFYIPFTFSNPNTVSKIANRFRRDNNRRKIWFWGGQKKVMRGTLTSLYLLYFWCYILYSLPPRCCIQCSWWFFITVWYMLHNNALMRKIGMSLCRICAWPRAQSSLLKTNYRNTKTSRQQPRKFRKDFSNFTWIYAKF